MNDALRRRWESSIDRLAREMSPSRDWMNLATSEAVSFLSTEWLGKIAQHHSEPHRAHHNMAHVEDVLLSLDYIMGARDVRSLCSDVSVNVATTTLAAFFHDAIYDPRSSTNEKDSADLFLEFASGLADIIASSLRNGGNAADGDAIRSELSDPARLEEIQQSPVKSQLMRGKITSEVRECIIATAAHISSADEARKSNNELLAAFLDADMSILGREASEYDRYAGCIRKEYQFVERSMYCEKRAEILESFLPASVDSRESPGVSKESNAASTGEDGKRRSHVYATEKGRKEWEEQARSNLRREIDMLRRGVIPCEEEG